MEGVELGDIEMGPADQDDSMEDVGSRVSGVTTRGAGNSPRRTRSGKVVKYRDG